MSARSDAALGYARQGYRVVPDLGKRPPFKEWQKLASSDPGQIAQWWREWPNANVGLLCGHRFVVLDVDPRNGGDAALAELIAKHGPLPETAKVATGGGGWHFYFAITGPVATHDLAKGLELCAVGHQVVAPPSIHPDTGREYVWLARPPLAPMPPCLIEVAHDDDGGDRAGTSPDVWTRMLRDGIPAGSRNVSLARLVGYLLRRRVAVDVVAELVHLVNEHCCRPPKPQAEVERIINSIAAKELRRREGSMR